MNVEIDVFLNIFGLSCLLVAVLCSDPYKWFLEKIWSDKWIAYIYFQRLISCPMCLTFWIVLISTLNPLYAGIGYVMSKIISNNVWK